MKGGWGQRPPPGQRYLSRPSSLWLAQVATRQGVCSGLKEVLENVSRQQLAEHLGVLLPLVQGALLDADPAVRQVQPLCA